MGDGFQPRLQLPVLQRVETKSLLSLDAPREFNGSVFDSFEVGLQGTPDTAVQSLLAFEGVEVTMEDGAARTAALPVALIGGDRAGVAVTEEHGCTVNLVHSLGLVHHAIEWRNGRDRDQHPPGAVCGVRCA